MSFFKFTELRRIQCVLRLCYDIIYYKEIENVKRKAKSEEINYQVQKKFNEFAKTVKIYDFVGGEKKCKKKFSIRRKHFTFKL